MINAAWIESQLEGERLGHPFIVKETVGSTNDEVRALAEAGAPEGAVVFAEHQTAGRGRAGRRWVSPPGASVILSVLLRPNLPASRAYLLTALAAVSTAAAVEAATGLNPELKWPNDLMISARGTSASAKKFAGILTELGLLGDEIEYAVVGIGINVKTRFAGELAETATSLEAELGAPVSREQLVVNLLTEMGARYDAMSRGNLDEIYDEWRGRLSTIGKSVRVLYQSADASPTPPVEGVAVDVDEDGSLILRKSDGSLERIAVGDVSVR